MIIMVFISHKMKRNRRQQLCKIWGWVNKMHYGLCGSIQKVQSPCATAGIEKKEHTTPGKSLQSSYQLNKVLSFYYNIYSAKLFSSYSTCDLSDPHQFLCIYLNKLRSFFLSLSRGYHITMTCKKPLHLINWFLYMQLSY